MTSREYLRLAATRGSKLGLERVTELCRLIGDPQEKVGIIHVAGTNGKGSFCAMLSGILTASGYKVGGFSSPALVDTTESFTIDGSPITESEFDELISELIPYCEQMTDEPTEFEVLTAAAYLLFAKKNCRFAVVECGMGGDTDSTNVVRSPILSVITNVATDHTAFLGSTITEIASHKAGIIKPHRPVLYGGNSAEALAVIERKTAENSALLTVTDMSRIKSSDSDLHGTVVDFDGFGEVCTRLTGTYQQYNLANVLTAVELLRNEGIDIPKTAVSRGLADVRHKGRFEIMSHDPLIIFDGAHNPDGIIGAAESIRKYFDQKVALLIGVMADKDYGLYPELLGELTDRVFAVTPDNPRALESKKLADAFAEKGIHANSFNDIDDGIRAAFDYASRKKIPLIALGSLYMYREFTDSLSRICPHDLRG